MAVTFTAIPKHHFIVKGARILYEPSIFNGNGQEVRKNLVLQVDEATRDQLTAIEVQLQLGETLCSIIKPEAIRVKVDMEQLRLFDSDHNHINPPEEWAQTNVEACLEVRGHWRTATNAGLSVCCTDIRFLEEACTSPFK